LNNDEVGRASDRSIMPLLMPGDTIITVQSECRTFVDVVCDVCIFVLTMRSEGFGVRLCLL